MIPRRAIDVLANGQWTGPVVGTVTLPFEERHRRRVRMTDDAGEAFLLDLAHATMLRDGDALVLDGGARLRVVAASEPVADIQCLDGKHFARVAWHLGNRHLPVQVLDGGRIRIADDHVIVAMAKGLGAAVTRLSAPFQPEAGAYDGGGHSHSHSHSHGHGHGEHRHAV